MSSVDDIIEDDDDEYLEDFDASPLKRANTEEVGDGYSEDGFDADGDVPSLRRVATEEVIGEPSEGDGYDDDFGAEEEEQAFSPEDEDAYAEDFPDDAEAYEDEFEEAAAASPSPPEADDNSDGGVYEDNDFEGGDSFEKDAAAAEARRASTMAVHAPAADGDAQSYGDDFASQPSVESGFVENDVEAAPARPRSETETAIAPADDDYGDEDFPEQPANEDYADDFSAGADAGRPPSPQPSVELPVSVEEPTPAAPEPSAGGYSEAFDSDAPPATLVEKSSQRYDEEEFEPVAVVEATSTYQEEEFEPETPVATTASPAGRGSGGGGRRGGVARLGRDDDAGARRGRARSSAVGGVERLGLQRASAASAPPRSLAGGLGDGLAGGDVDAARGPVRAWDDRFEEKEPQTVRPVAVGAALRHVRAVAAAGDQPARPGGAAPVFRVVVHKQKKPPAPSTYDASTGHRVNAKDYEASLQFKVTSTSKHASTMSELGLEVGKNGSLKVNKAKAKWTDASAARLVAAGAKPYERPPPASPPKKVPAGYPTTALQQSARHYVDRCARWQKIESGGKYGRLLAAGDFKGAAAIEPRRPFDPSKSPANEPRTWKAYKLRRWDALVTVEAILNRGRQLSTRHDPSRYAAEAEKAARAALDALGACVAASVVSLVESPANSGDKNRVARWRSRSPSSRTRTRGRGRRSSSKIARRTWPSESYVKKRVDEFGAVGAFSAADARKTLEDAPSAPGPRTASCPGTGTATTGPRPTRPKLPDVPQFVEAKRNGGAAALFNNAAPAAPKPKQQPEEAARDPTEAPPAEDADDEDENDAYDEPDFDEPAAAEPAAVAQTAAAPEPEPEPAAAAQTDERTEEPSRNNASQYQGVVYTGPAPAAEEAEEDHEAADAAPAPIVVPDHEKEPFAEALSTLTEEDALALPNVRRGHAKLLAVVAKRVANDLAEAALAGDAPAEADEAGAPAKAADDGDDDADRPARKTVRPLKGKKHNKRFVEPEKVKPPEPEPEPEEEAEIEYVASPWALKKPDKPKKKKPEEAPKEPEPVREEFDPSTAARGAKTRPESGRRERRKSRENAPPKPSPRDEPDPRPTAEEVARIDGAVEAIRAALGGMEDLEAALAGLADAEDGKVSAAGLRRLVKKRGLEDPTPAVLEALLTAVDIDGDGAVPPQDAAVFARGQVPGGEGLGTLWRSVRAVVSATKYDVTRLEEQLFAKYDADAEGHISLKKFRSTLEKVAKKTRDLDLDGADWGLVQAIWGVPDRIDYVTFCSWLNPTKTSKLKAKASRLAVKACKESGETDGDFWTQLCMRHAPPAEAQAFEMLLYDGRKKKKKQAMEEEEDPMLRKERRKSKAKAKKKERKGDENDEGNAGPGLSSLGGAPKLT
ncbi:hypothetical protein JL721_8924 [Aureococcus anophagefferens]|nr:hypothetical protein JL721_8924 [Aureococcus anophagefferens]